MSGEIKHNVVLFDDDLNIYEWTDINLSFRIHKDDLVHYELLDRYGKFNGSDDDKGRFYKLALQNDDEFAIDEILVTHLGNITVRLKNRVVNVITKSFDSLAVGDMVECIRIVGGATNLTLGKTYTVVGLQPRWGFNIRDDNNRKKRYRYTNPYCIWKIV